jgi:hypothetical protein
MLRHGIKREVFISEFASNAFSILKKGKGRPNLKSLLSVRDIAVLAVKRWMVPRAERRPEYRSWKAGDLIALLSERRIPLRVPAKQTSVRSTG